MRRRPELLKGASFGGRRDEVENTPAPPRARLGVFNPLTIAVAIVLLAAGGAFGWQRTHAPSARPTPEAAAAALALERIDARTICAPGGADDLRDATLATSGAEPPARLADHLPKRSPLPGYGRTDARAVDPSVDTDFLSGAVEGQVVSFRPEGEGGFDVFAYTFLTRRAAADSLVANVTRRVCELDAVPFAAKGRPGMVVLQERGNRLSAWWAARGDLVVLEYAGWGDGRTGLANVAAIAGATALY